MKQEKSVKKENFFRTQYRKSWSFIKESRNYIFASIAIFVFFTLVGFFVPLPEDVSRSILDMLKQILGRVQGLSWAGTIGFIFLNNVQSSFFGMVLGALFGVFPVIAAVINGYLLGFVASVAVGSGGLVSLWKIFPHGIFELPAVFISLGIGIKLGLWLIVEPFKFYWKKNKIISFLFILVYFPTILLTLIYNKKLRENMNFYISRNFPFNFQSSLRVFVFVVIPLLIIAAIIEGSLIFLLK